MYNNVAFYANQNLMVKTNMQSVTFYVITWSYSQVILKSSMLIVKSGGLPGTNDLPRWIDTFSS